MRVKINQLDEEVNERNTDLIIQQLKKENDRLHQLVNNHHESHVKRISVVVSIHVCKHSDRVAMYIHILCMYITYLGTYIFSFVYIMGQHTVAQKFFDDTKLSPHTFAVNAV